MPKKVRLPSKMKMGRNGDGGDRAPEAKRIATSRFQVLDIRLVISPLL
jgi:hypothetical protein